MFLEQSRRKTISESFLRYSMAKYLGTPRRQIGAGIGLMLMILVSWALIALLFGKAANVAYQLSRATEQPTGTKPSPSLTVPAPATQAKPEQERSVPAFNGEEGGILVKYNPTFNLTTAMTAEAWIWAEDPPRGAIVNRDNPKIGPWSLLFSDNGKLRSDVAWGNWNPTPEASYRAIPAKSWLHIAMVFDGQEVRHYVNGQKVASYPAKIKLTINDNDLTVGRDPYRNRTFKGRIAGVRVSNAALYNSNFTPNPRLAKLPSTVLLLPLDEGSGSVAKDDSGHGNDGVITNGTWVTVSQEEFRIAGSAQSPEAKAPAAAPTDLRRRVLLDMSHDFGFEPSNGLLYDEGYLLPKGYVVMDTEAGLREEVLKCFDVLILYHIDTDTQYSDKEVECVKAFVQRGGGLLMYAEAGAIAKPLPLNRIAREFGLEFLPEQAQGPITAAAGFGSAVSYNARLLRVSAADHKPIAHDSKGRPVIVEVPWKAGRIVAVSGSGFLTNPAASRALANAGAVESLFQWLASVQVADKSVDVLGMAGTWSTRVDPDRVIEAGTFRILCPDPLPEARAKFLLEKAPIIYSKVSELFGYDTGEQKTVIALMCDGSGWTASPTLVGIGVLGDEIAVVSVLCHEFANSLSIETPMWLGDAGWSAMVQVKVKTTLGGKFAASVNGQMARQIAEYHKWELAHGLYDLSSEKNIWVGEGKVMAIISDFEKRYGADIMKRYFAVARKWKDNPAVSKHSISDRVVFYFSLATGEDQYPYFKKLGTNVQRIDLPAKQEQSTPQVGEESVPAPAVP